MDLPLLTNITWCDPNLLCGACAAIAGCRYCSSVTAPSANGTLLHGVCVDNMTQCPSNSFPFNVTACPAWPTYVPDFKINFTEGAAYKFLFVFICIGAAATLIAGFLSGCGKIPPQASVAISGGFTVLSVFVQFVFFCINLGKILRDEIRPCGLDLLPNRTQYDAAGPVSLGDSGVLSWWPFWFVGANLDVAIVVAAKTFVTAKITASVDQEAKLSPGCGESCAVKSGGAFAKLGVGVFFGLLGMVWTSALAPIASLPLNEDCFQMADYAGNMHYGGIFRTIVSVVIVLKIITLFSQAQSGDNNKEQVQTLLGTALLTLVVSGIVISCILLHRVIHIDALWDEFQRNAANGFYHVTTSIALIGVESVGFLVACGNCDVCHHTHHHAAKAGGSLCGKICACLSSLCNCCKESWTAGESTALLAPGAVQLAADVCADVAEEKLHERRLRKKKEGEEDEEAEKKNEESSDGVVGLATAAVNMSPREAEET